MSTESFDAAAAHRHFAPICFNRAWELIEKTNRTLSENDVGSPGTELEFAL